LNFLLRTFCEIFCIHMRKPKEPCIHISMQDKPGAFTKTHSVWFGLIWFDNYKDDQNIGAEPPPQPNPQIGDDLGYSWPYWPVGVYTNTLIAFKC
jgi:hypothetical protein